MKESMITAVLAVCSIVLIGLAAVGIVTEDKTAPVISLEGKNTLTYTKGESYRVLLEDVKAEDNKDGDVTDSVRVSNIYVTSKDRAMVVYVAKDKANNISKMKREVYYIAPEEPAEPEESAADEVSEEEKASNENTLRFWKAVQKAVQVQLNAAEAKVDAQTETAETNAQAETEETNAQTPTEDATVSEENQNGPKLTMIQNEAALKVGETFNILRYIESAVDTDGSSLSRYIHAEGTYDMSQPGVYTIRVYASSPAGANSNVETFTLTVEP